MKQCVLVFCVSVLLSLPLLSQSEINSTFYLEPGYNMPFSGYGYPVNYTGVNNSLNTYGAGVGAGVILYMSDSETPQLIHVGLDYTLAEVSVNSNNIAYLEEDFGGQSYVTETSLVSRMVSMKLGPVVTFVPKDRLALDVFMQGQLGLSSLDFYNEKEASVDQGSNMEVQYRLAGGLRIGYYKTFLKIEYSYGVPTIKKASSQNTLSTQSLIEKHKVDQSYLRVALCIKFNSF